jgi:O-acetyl-ADP-ribose deacetylase (regulator of RNase III)
MRVILIDRSALLSKEWLSQLISFRRASKILEFQGREVTIEIQNRDIDQLEIANGKTVVVTPGNSAGLMGGGIDMAIRDCFVGINSTDETIQRHVSEELQFYKAPGVPTWIRFPSEMIHGSIALDKWKCNDLIHLPTMRVPEHIKETPREFHKSLFDWTWSVLSVLNKDIDTLVIPGLGTGYGKAPLDLCAASMVGALTIHYARGYTSMEKTVLVYKFLGDDYKKLDITTMLDHNLEFTFGDSLEELFAHKSIQ